MARAKQKFHSGALFASLLLTLFTGSGCLSSLSDESHIPYTLYQILLNSAGMPGFALTGGDSLDVAESGTTGVVCTLGTPWLSPNGTELGRMGTRGNNGVASISNGSGACSIGGYALVCIQQ